MHEPGFPSAPLVTKVELTVSARNLKDKDITSKSDPLCILYIRECGIDKFFEVGRTEQIKNDLNPFWTTKFEVDYRFEERQVLRFHVYDWDTKSSNPDEQDSLGITECSLGEIMSSKGRTFTKPLTNHGIICIRGDELSSSKEIVTMQFSGKNLDKKDTFGKSDPFLIFYFCTDNNEYVPVHKTEYIKNTLNPTWKRMTIPVRYLCGGDDDQTVKIVCNDYDNDGSHDLIGECFTNLKNLRQSTSSVNNYDLINPKKKAKKSSYKNSGQLILNHCSVRVEHTFLDYIQSGLQMHFTVAVDFTASNGDPRERGSLHYRQKGVDNQYAVAIKSVGEIIQDYDSDKLFPALGFGARIPPNGDISFEFFLNGSADNPYCQGVEGILQAYHHSLQTVTLYGPTNFTPVIRHVMQFAKANQDGTAYFVLLIITDGIISDLAATKAALIEASQLPMSVIIVGVGSEDFSTMELLDGDTERLSMGGLYARRDIVQFVEMRAFFSADNFQLMRSNLAKAVLKEIPKQVVEFMNARQMLPPNAP